MSNVDACDVLCVAQQQQQQQSQDAIRQWRQ